MSTAALDILKKYWDYHEFRPLQEDIINAVLEKKNTLALLPTGGGKSICYQIPGILLDGICLVVSPLIALMKDQVNGLNQRGIKAIALDSSLSFQDLNRELDNCLYGQYKFIYLSPERLQSELILERLKQFPINLLAVDEAHCISQWGHDFRPAYANIAILKQIFPKLTTIAVTGSATQKVIQDIEQQLQLEDLSVYKQSFRRENLAYMSLNTIDKYQKIVQILRKNPASSILYVRNRKKTQEISNHLNKMGFSSSFYHGGLTPNEKEKSYLSWYHNHSQVMVATNAFGMGIDKPDVKTVIHLDLPENLESYYQEAGRAGRNNQKAFAILLYNDTDIERLKHQHLQYLPTKKDLLVIYKKLCSYLTIAYQEGQHQIFDFNIYKFSQTYSFPINTVVNSLQFLDRQGILRFSKQFKNQTRLKFLVSSHQLIHFINTHNHYNSLLNTILRKYGGAFETTINIDLNFLSLQLQLNTKEIQEQLQFLAQQEIIELSISNSDITLMLLEPREDEYTINRIAHHLEQQNELKQKQIDNVVNYVLNDTSCKENLLLCYFGETNLGPCLTCSYCLKDKLNPKAPNLETVAKTILELTQNNPLSLSEIETQLHYESSVLIQVIRLLIDNNSLHLSDHQKYYH